MDDLEKINEERRRRGLPPLTREQHAQARAAHRVTGASDDDFWHFVVAYSTGFPMPSGMGVVGAMLSPNSVFSPAHSSPAPDPSPSYSAPDPSPSYSAPDPSPSYSSPSYDSGSSGGGFDSGGSAAP